MCKDLDLSVLKMTDKNEVVNFILNNSNFEGYIIRQLSSDLLNSFNDISILYEVFLDNKYDFIAPFLKREFTLAMLQLIALNVDTNHFDSYSLLNIKYYYDTFEPLIAVAKNSDDEQNSDNYD